MKYIKIILINILIGLYFFELLLIFFFKEVKNLTAEQIKINKIEIAKSSGLPYDKRDKKDVFIELNKVNKDIKPGFNFAPSYRFSKVFQNALKNNKLIPFRGPLNSKSLTCAEDLEFKLINNDKYGFKNFNETYKKKIHTMILGDSFAVGMCQDNFNDITGNLKKKGLNTINLGVSGSSTLISLAILSEFGEYLSPKNIVYLYYEGNDLEGLEWEKQISILMKYYEDDNYKIDYLNKYDEINDFLKNSEAESLRYIYSSDNIKTETIYTKKEKLIDFIELKRLKKLIRKKILKQTDFDYNTSFLINILKKMSEKSASFSENFLFVYIPDASRYTSESHTLEQRIKFNYKDKLIKKIKNLNIEVLDLTKFLDSSDDPKQFYPFGFYGHFNKNGYKEITELIYLNLKK